MGADFSKLKLIGWIHFALLVLSILAEAEAKSPTGGYSPGYVSCPSENIVRPADDISESERAYIEGRMETAQKALKDFVARQNLKDINVDDFFSLSGGPNERPNTAVGVGLAVSGGGYRSLMIGGGVISALDNRDQPGMRRGVLAGLLQGMTHFSALSSGSWLLGSMYLNDFKTIAQLRQSNRIWHFENNMLLPNNGNNFFLSDGLFYSTAGAQMGTKVASGYGVTMTDLYGRLISRMFIDRDGNNNNNNNNNNNGGGSAALTWSDITTMDYFYNHIAPYPIMSAISRVNGSNDDVGPNSTLIEITPHEIGSFDSSLHSFAKLKYLGTNLENNKVKQNNNNNNNNGDRRCVGGYDNAGLMVGASSNIFNKVLQRLSQSNNFFIAAMGTFASMVFDPTNLDVALFQPNPFYKYQNPTYRPTSDSIFKQQYLGLTDGAFGGENVPLYPLLYKPRGLDLIVTVDVSGDTPIHWPAGVSLINTYARVSGNIKNSEEGTGINPATGAHYQQKHFMPRVPDENSFVNLGLSTRPTFFGCYAMDYMSDDEMKHRDFSKVPPILLYMPNTPMSYMSNKDTFQFTYEKEETDKMFQNGFDMADQSFSGGDPNWGKCVACATIQRERERQGKFEPTDECGACFDKYCWNGNLDPRDYQSTKLHNNPTVNHR
ncbi:uncharacterized protein SAPINGB_P002128 [Magnusiomyces paraingens]|uniref:Lysophospholipase n=1 Tax=Magnusiomyces paraingens TaxID=2606893 RepID=A0A5E8BDN9_9ASCO|nr:uncharacterized protein SAPINGB_P002128 [Saprochaete ingens]VVT49151.1 unnamed protein product [Saprochaete ingens]